MTELSVIIVNRNVRELLKQCLQSVRSEWPWPDKGLELIVVDNASCDGSAETISADFPGVKLIKNPDNPGFGRACNQGMAVSSGRYLMILNPDTVIRKGLFQSLIEFMDHTPQAGLAGPKVLNRDGSLQPTYRRFPTYANIIFARKSPLSKILPGNPGSKKYLQKEIALDRPRRVEALGGVCIILRREMLEEVGKFDENIFMYLEDTDLCYRAHLQGWESWVVPQAELVHHWGKSTEQEKRKMAEEHRRSVYYYFGKHYDPSFIQRAYLKAGLSIHKLFD
ncbi:MAG: glycosyltransferase family 2 protein [Candidatus Edwardsbacteria bacterium]|nr:glycosyltransferase family 2 protein [Candidatus Edwardsbacteria bacterium]